MSKRHDMYFAPNIYKTTSILCTTDDVRHREHLQVNKMWVLPCEGGEIHINRLWKVLGYGILNNRNDDDQFSGMSASFLLLYLDSQITRRNHSLYCILSPCI
jgi:hypothetical protein